METQQLNLTHNEILKLHSSQERCASCHRHIDPIGFGLEIFDQQGIRRTSSENYPPGQQLHWTSEQTAENYADQTWTLTQPVVGGKKIRVIFQFSHGKHRLNVKNVRLESGDIQLVDKHFGFSGNTHRDNSWFFSIPPNGPTTGWRLTAEIQGDGGTDSNGVITVSRSRDQTPTHKLPNGKSFTSPAELKRLLLTDYREPIIDNAIRRVLAYALGRSIEPVDRPAIRQIKKSIKVKDYRMTALLESVVLSYPFRYKEGEDPFAPKD